jgi:hypothetical protein
LRYGMVWGSAYRHMLVTLDEAFKPQAISFISGNHWNSCASLEGS